MNPIAPPAPIAGIRAQPWLAAACLAACAVLLVLRRPDMVLDPQLWAEDGNVFLLGAYRDGWRAFLDPYAGYLHVIPRLIAWAAAQLDPCWVPGAFVYGSAVVTLLVVARLFSPRFPLSGRVIMGLAVVAVAHSGEVYLNPTNLQWITALALVVTLLLDDAVTAYDWVVDTVVVLAVGLTGPFSIFVAPCFLLRGLVRRTRASWIIAALVACVATVQGWLVLHHTPAPPPWHPTGPVDSFNLAAVVATRLPLALFGAQAWVQHVGRGAAVVLGVAIVVAIAAVSLRRDAVRNGQLALVVLGVLLMGFSMAKIRADSWPYGEMQVADRYFFIPRVLLLWILASTVDFASWRGRTAAGILIAAVVCAAPVFRAPPIPHFDWSRYCSRLAAGRATEVETSPGWKYVLPGRPRK